MSANAKKTNIFSTPYLTRMAILTAIAFILFLVQIPVVAFYKLDLSNIPVLLGAFSMGTVPGIIILALKCSLALLRTTSAGVGDLADFLMSAALIIPARADRHGDRHAVHGGRRRAGEQVYHAALLYGSIPHGHGRHPEICQRGRH